MRHCNIWWCVRRGYVKDLMEKVGIYGVSCVLFDGGKLWEVMLVMFSTFDQTKYSSGFRSGEEGGQWEKGIKS